MIHIEKVADRSVIVKIEGTDETLGLEMKSMLRALSNDDRLDKLFTESLLHGIEGDTIEIHLKGSKEAIEALGKAKKVNPGIFEELFERIALVGLLDEEERSFEA